MVLESVDLGPLADEEIEIAVEHCGLCHSDLSVLNNAWGISQYRAILGHEVVGRVTVLGPNAKGLNNASRHNIAPLTEHLPMNKINEALARLESGKAYYRIVLDADF
jgi:D-arabinose 1-dehydrogenase-like Zn-dependent alcohol dehydrogenase